jgi:23S rRNA pseudouridine955/2504/2580 synthase
VKPDESGKPATTVFQPIEHYGRIAVLLGIRILTGRTHQIRVHASHLGHPLAGDERYGEPSFNALMAGLGLRRMFLHAQALAFTWPESQEEFAVHAPLPPDLGACLDRLASLGARERERLEARLT